MKGFNKGIRGFIDIFTTKDFHSCLGKIKDYSVVWNNERARWNVDQAANKQVVTTPTRQ